MFDFSESQSIKNKSKLRSSGFGVEATVAEKRKRDSLLPDKLRSAPLAQTPQPLNALH